MAAPDPAAVATPQTSVGTRRRLLIAFALGALVAARTYLAGANPHDPTDFGQVWFAARSILHGVDPYPLVGPDRAFPIEYALVYPLTAAVAVLPLALLPLQLACAVFFGLGATAFAWALMRRGYAPLLAMMSASIFFAAEEAQWSALLAAALVLPPLGIFFAAKPTIGAALFAARPSWWPLGGGAILLLVSLILQPHWPAAWWHAVTLAPPAPGAPAPYLSPVRLPFGFLALLCLLRWRRPEARLVAALACVPQSGLLYETVPLFLVPQTIWESAVLTVASYGVVWWMQHQTFHGDYVAYLAASGRAITLGLYLPATVMVLLRPNQGGVPESIETRIARWPHWLRGRALVDV